RAADSRQGAVGDLRPLGLVSRKHVCGPIGGRRGRGQALVRAEADELSRPRANLQAWPEELSRPAVTIGRIRRGASLRAVGRDAWIDARARLHPGRRACVLHGSPARRRVPEDQRSHPVDLRGFRLRGRSHGKTLDPAGQARRHRRDVGSFRARDGDGSKKVPVMVHRAICGSMERFIGILIEHYAGNFPLWLAPIQAVVTTITSEGDEYAKVVAAAARRAGLRVELDLRNEKINYKVREHSLAKIPALLVVGKKEAETHSVSVRRLGSDGQKVMPTDEALAALVDEAMPPDVKRARVAA